MPDDRLIHRACGHSVKVNALTDFERLVWALGYKLAADDFGVMRFSALSLQEAAEWLEKRRPKQIQAALARVKAVGLIDTFEHQGRLYCFDPVWQTWQKITHPRQTKQPAPPLDRVDLNTRWLLKHHPKGGRLQSWQAPDLHPKDAGRKPGAHREETGSAPEMNPVGTGPVFVGSGCVCVSGERKRAEGKAEDPKIASLASALSEIYPEVYAKCRAGAVYRTTQKTFERDWPNYYAAAELHPDSARLRALLEIFLTRPFGDKSSPGTPGQFVHMLPECDEVLRRSGWQAAV